MEHSKRATTIFYIKIGLAVLGVIGFVLIVLSYNAFHSIDARYEEKLEKQMSQFAETYSSHLDSIISLNRAMVGQQNNEVVESLQKNDSVLDSRFSVMERRFVSLSKMQQFVGQYVISDYKVESPSVGLLKIKYTDLGLDSAQFSESPSVFIQEHGEFKARIIELNNESIKVKISNTQERFVEMDLLIFTH